MKKESKILYLLGQVPTLSETFIINEVLGLVDRGMPILPLSLARPQCLTPDMHKSGRRLATITRYLPTRPYLLWAFVSALARNPLKLTKLLFWNHRLPCVSHSSRLKRYLKAVFVLSVVIAEDIKYIHAHWTTQSDIALMIRLASGVPFSFTLHAHDLFEEAVTSLWEEKFGTQFKIQKCEFLSTCTEYNRQYLLRLCGSELHHKINTVYHGVDTDSFRKRTTENYDCPELISVGRIVDYKGFDRIVRVCVRLKKEGYQFRCRIIGDGSKRKELAREVAALDLTDSILFLGPLPHHKVSELYGESDIFLLAGDVKKGQHGLPNVLVEAASSGLAIVTTELPPVRELIEHGTTGLIASDGDESYYCCLRTLLDSHEQRIRLGRNARAIATSKFGFDENIVRLEFLLRDAIQSPIFD